VCRPASREEAPAKRVSRPGPTTHRASDVPRATTNASSEALLPARICHAYTAQHVSSAITKARMDEALCLAAATCNTRTNSRTLLTFRERSRGMPGRSPCLAPHTALGPPCGARTACNVPRRHPPRPPWAKPCMAATTYKARTPRNAPRTMTKAHTGEALFGGPTHGAPTLAVSREAHLASPPVWDGAS
jgi:hypothetical protein